MKTYDVSEVKNRFGALLQESLQEPVGVRETGQIISVLMSLREYERLIALEDAYWLTKAEAAEKEGFIGPAATMVFLEELSREKS